MPLQVTTARRLVRELKARGRLEVTDEALVNVFVGLAAAVDESPDNAALWRQLRECEQDVRGVGGSDPDAVQALLDELAGAPEVRDPSAD